LKEIAGASRCAGGDGMRPFRENAFYLLAWRAFLAALITLVYNDAEPKINFVNDGLIDSGRDYQLGKNAGQLSFVPKGSRHA
jgi:hypothetical protein